MTAELEPDSAWVVDDTGFPKQGDDSVGMDRQYSGTLGKTGNCQVAVSLHHVGEQGNAVLGWRLYLPETWTKDPERRQAAGVPEAVVFKKKWEGSLARRKQRLVGVTLPLSAGTAIPRIRRWRSAAQGNLATGGVAGSGEGTPQILLLRFAGELHTALPPRISGEYPKGDQRAIVSICACDFPVRSCGRLTLIRRASQSMIPEASSYASASSK